MENPTCKTCTHCRANWFERTLNLNPVLWECDQMTEEGSVNLVTGKRRPDKFKSCSEMRVLYCGQEGKLWSPRDDRKYLFYMLKR